MKANNRIRDLRRRSHHAGLAAPGTTTQRREFSDAQVWEAIQLLQRAEAGAELSLSATDRHSLLMAEFRLRDTRQANRLLKYVAGQQQENAH